MKGRRWLWYIICAYTFMLYVLCLKSLSVRGFVILLSCSTVDLNFTRFRHFCNAEYKLSWRNRVLSIITGISYKLWNKNVKGWRRLIVASQEQRVCHVEIWNYLVYTKGNYEVDHPCRSIWVNRDADLLFYVLSFVSSSTGYILLK